MIWIDGGTKEGKEKFHKEGYCNRKNVILLGSLLSRTDVETTIKKKLPKENLPKAFQGETYIFQIGDLWALNQHSIIIAANSKDALEYEAVMPNAEKIRKMYTDSLNTIVERVGKGRHPTILWIRSLKLSPGIKLNSKFFGRVKFRLSVDDLGKVQLAGDLADDVAHRFT